MPANYHGCGTMYCGYSAPIHWTDPGLIVTTSADHDAMVCVTLFMLPLIPLRACHVYDQAGGVCREAPLRWSGHLVLRAFLRPWLFAVIVLGIFAALGAGGAVF